MSHTYSTQTYPHPECDLLKWWWMSKRIWQLTMRRRMIVWGEVKLCETEGLKLVSARVRFCHIWHSHCSWPETLRLPPHSFADLFLSSCICIWICSCICICICICVCICSCICSCSCICICICACIFICIYTYIYGTPTADQRVFRLTHLLISFCHIVFGFVFVLLFVLLLFE